MLSRRHFGLALASGALLAACGEKAGPVITAPRKVKMAVLPYGDHAQAIIGVRKGWFAEAGLDVELTPIKIEQVVPFLKGGQYDVISTPPGVLIAGWNDAKNLVMFSFGSIFQGFALMAQPDKGLKSYSEFVAEGMPAQDALKAAALQIKGNKFAYAPEGGMRPFIDLLLDTAQLTSSQFSALVVDDPVGVAAMQRKEAMFHVGGAPSRITLQKAGFKVIVSSADFAKAAAPARTSKELRAVFPDGWAMKRELFEAEPDLAAKMASVSFRINDLIKSNPSEASSLHMPYLSQITGQPFDEADARVLYNDLDPFLTFEEQAPWFENPGNPLYFQNLIGSHIDSYVEDKLFTGAPPKVEDVIVAQTVYARLKAAAKNCGTGAANTASRNYLACEPS